MNAEVDPYDTPEYQQFVEEMAKHCDCPPHIRPCEGVLSGGICDKAGCRDYNDSRDDDDIEE